MREPLTAVLDPALSASVITRAPLLYDEGASAELDRPAHVRSGSGLAWVPGGLAVVQDDANFIAIHDPRSGRTGAITLPAGEAGLRQFDDIRGNKRYKLDLESCLTLEGRDGTILLALGSGSTSRREHVVMVDRWEDHAPRVRLVSAPDLYQALRNEASFAGSRLNIEGAVRVDNSVRIFSRGNSAPRRGTPSVNATCDLDLDTLLAYLRAPMKVAPPTPALPVHYQLGTIDGVRLGFTDALAWGDAMLYTATAEVSADATQDGPVSGSAIGVIDPGGTVRWAPLTDTRGELLVAKVEGLAHVPGAPAGLYIVLDNDDPAAASELCRVELSGPWRPVSSSSLPTPG
jgi:hypothetical protein